MEYNWEDFEDGPTPKPGEGIHVTLNTRCKLFFNRHALSALGDPDGVALMFDRRRGVIGVKASPLNRKSAYKLWDKESGNGRSASGQMISAKGFCVRYGIAPEQILAFTTAQVRDGILILDLNEVRSAEKAKRK